MWENNEYVYVNPSVLMVTAGIGYWLEWLLELIYVC